MSSFYLLGIDIFAKANLSEKQFRELIAPQTAYLDALNGSFEKKPCNVFFYPPDPDGKNTEWSARCAVTIFVGKERAVHLCELYHLIARLIKTELHPLCEVQYEIGNFQIS